MTPEPTSTRRIMEYLVLQHEDSVGLGKMILNLHRNEGHEPLGGVAVVRIAEGIYGFYQAMVRYEEEGQ